MEFPTGEYENWVQCQVFFPYAKSAVSQRPRTEDSLLQWASLLYHASWYAWKRGNVAGTVKMSKKSMEARKEILGKEHEETLNSIEMVGMAYKLGVSMPGG